MPPSHAWKRVDSPHMEAFKQYMNTLELSISLVPRPHLARVPRVILKAVRAGVGLGSGTETS